VVVARFGVAASTATVIPASSAGRCGARTAVVSAIDTAVAVTRFDSPATVVAWRGCGPAVVVAWFGLPATVVVAGFGMPAPVVAGFGFAPAVIVAGLQVLATRARRLHGAPDDAVVAWLGVPGGSDGADRGRYRLAGHPHRHSVAQRRVAGQPGHGGDRCRDGRRGDHQQSLHGTSFRSVCRPRPTITGRWSGAP
jgi:hypothetical protein